MAIPAGSPLRGTVVRMSSPKQHRTRSMDRETLRSTLEVTLAGHGMTLEEFVAAGIADTLREDELRDLWLSVSIIAKRLVQS